MDSINHFNPLTHKKHSQPEFSVTRTYYRNIFFHLGHIKTILDNERIAKKHNGVCYAIIDDRLNKTRTNSIKEDFKYLELEHMKVISVREYQSDIMKYTCDLIQKGDIYLYHCSTKETKASKIISFISYPREHFQLRLNCGLGNDDPSIGYTNQDETGTLKLIMIFDYIIKVLDIILGVTDIVSTSVTAADIKDQNISQFFDNITNIRHHKLDTYHIHNFRYSKHGWNIDNESNPYLLTFKGLKARHIPACILKAFYIHACQMGSIKIKYLGDLLKSYLRKNSQRVLGVIKPVKVIIDNWREKRTEYVCSYGDGGDVKYFPLSNILYIDSSDYGMDYGKITAQRRLKLTYGPTLRCTSVDIESNSPPTLHAEFKSTDDKNCFESSFNWISSAWELQPCSVRFYLYNWFYTGHNNLLLPEIVDGSIDINAFKDLNKVYYIEGHGYFSYDRSLSATNGIPTFIRLGKFQ